MHLVIRAILLILIPNAIICLIPAFLDYDPKTMWIGVITICSMWDVGVAMGMMIAIHRSHKCKPPQKPPTSTN